MKEKALKKLKTESASGTYGQKALVMKNDVRAALENFVRQDEEFAQAVVQGGTFAECMEVVAKGVGNSISDLEAFRKAVQFYFPTAEVRFQMKIDLVPHDTEDETPVEEPERKRAVVVDLADFL